MAAGPVVPIYCIPLVKFDGGGEVCDGLIVLEEAVPDKATAIVGWRVLLVKFDDLVEILQC